MKNITSLVGSLILMFSLFSCQTTKQSMDTNVPFYVQVFLAKENLTNVSFSLNESKEMVLCSHFNKESRILNYSVYNMNTQQEVYSNSAIDGSISWHSDVEIALSGTSRVEPESKTIINVLTKVVVK